MAVRKKSDYPIKNKRLSIRISENDVLRLKSISEKYNLVYLDIIKKGIEYIKQNDNNFDYTVSSSIKNKLLVIKVTDDELQYIKTNVKNKNLTYFDAIMLGLKHYESL